MMLPALLSPWRAVLVMGFAFALTSSPVGATAPTPPAVPTALAAVQLQLMMRTADGAPVPGIHVELVPAAPDAGGPPAGTSAKAAITNATGMVVFAELQGAIWWASFHGIYRGQPLAAVAAQGQPPYGTTHGGGFVVQAALQEENDAPAPVVGQPAPAVETLAFVLLPTGAGWTPALDLAAPGSLPQPLGTVAAATALPLLPPPEVRALPTLDTNRSPDLTLVWWLLPLGAAGGALFVTWRQRRTEQRVEPVPHDERGQTAAGQGRGGHG
jgi:hypothetical protein